MSDLVERLRESVCRLRKTASVVGITLSDEFAFLDDEAADEIERLRADAERYQKLSSRLLLHLGQICERALVFHRPGASHRPKKSAVAACSWIAEEAKAIIDAIAEDAGSARK